MSSNEAAGMSLATLSLLVVLINTLRGKGLFTDIGVQDLFQQVLDAIDEQMQEFPHDERLQSARRVVQAELERELSYPPRVKN